MLHIQMKRYFLSEIQSSNNNLDYERRNLKIAIIDDMDVPYLDNLRNNGFNVTHHRDIDNFEIMQIYPIIICDIKGVGKKFGSSKEGAHVIGEIRRLYPDKYIIAMSSVVYNIDWVKSLEVADDKIMRDSDVNKVLDAINKAIDIMKCNKQRWLRVRDNLINEHEIDLFDVWKIEQDFIKTALSKNNNIFKNSPSVNNMSDIVKGLLINFITGLVFQQ